MQSTVSKAASGGQNFALISEAFQKAHVETEIHFHSLGKYFSVVDRFIEPFKNMWTSHGNFATSIFQDF